MSGTRVRLNLGIVQMSMVEKKEKNLEKALSFIDLAAKKGAQIICLPELFTTLYFPQQERKIGENLKGIAERIPGPTTEKLSKASRDNGVVLVGGSILEQAGAEFYNTTAVFDETGRILGKYRKVHIPEDPSFYEQEYFSSGNLYRVFGTKFGRIAPLICFDQWYPEPARVNRLKGAQILFYPTAIGWVKGIKPAEGNWKEAWEGVQRGHAIANSIVVATVNRVGVENDMKFWGGSFVYDQFGNLLLRADDSEGVFIASCDLNLQDDVEAGWGFLKNRKPETYSNLAEYSKR